MSAEAARKTQVLRPTDVEAIRLAKTLLRSARSGALAALDPINGAPIVSRVGVATAIDGTPIILVSTLAAHTAAIAADNRCALLLGEPGKGDPLAHPRLSVDCHAEQIEKADDDHAHARRRYLARHPKASLYVDFPDFSFFKLNPIGASLNGGFGKAYKLDAADLLSDLVVASGLADVEVGAVAHMNDDHLDAVTLYATVFAKADAGDWRLVGIDPDGVDLILGDQLRRVFFPKPLQSAGEMRAALVTLARQARAATLAA